MCRNSAIDSDHDLPQLESASLMQPDTSNPPITLVNAYPVTITASHVNVMDSNGANSSANALCELVSDPVQDRTSNYPTMRMNTNAYNSNTAPTSFVNVIDSNGASSIDFLVNWYRTKGSITYQHKKATPMKTTTALGLMNHILSMFKTPYKLFFLFFIKYVINAYTPMIDKKIHTSKLSEFLHCIISNLDSNYNRALAKII